MRSGENYLSNRIEIEEEWLGAYQIASVLNSRGLAAVRGRIYSNDLSVCGTRAKKVISILENLAMLLHKGGNYVSFIFTC